jgi:hypothetical protein
VTAPPAGRVLVGNPEPESCLAVCGLGPVCSAVAATPNMKTLIAAGSDRKIKELEDNAVG